MTLGTAIGSLGMKGGGTAIAAPLRLPHQSDRHGDRSATVAYAACGLFRPDWPLPAVFAVMMVSGFLMSFQFTAYNTIAYDEIGKERMSAATTFYSTFQQLMLSFGICAGSTALRVSMAVRGAVDPGFADFSAAFFSVTAISLTAVFVNIRFHPKAGAEMCGQA
jgi:hypothetical protein